MKLKSSIYLNTSLNFGGTIIEFKGGRAEVSEEVYEEIIRSKFPNIYSEDTPVNIASKGQEDFNKDLDTVSKEYMVEIDRLKGIINFKNQEIAEAKNQAEIWKNAYNKDVAALKARLENVSSEEKVVANPEPKKEADSLKENPSSEDLKKEADSLKEELKKLKVAELRTMAVSECKISEEEVSKATNKEALIDLIIGKS